MTALKGKAAVKIGM